MSFDEKVERLEFSRVSAEPANNTPKQFPVSFGQRRLWFLDQLAPQNPVYNICTAQRLEGQLNLAALKASLAAVVERHEILRTRFSVVDGEPVQLIQPATQSVLQQIDLRHLAISQKQAEVTQILRQEAQTGFDMARGPLFRARLLVLNSDEFVWLFIVHQMIWDGWSFKVFYKELASFYESYLTGKPAVVPELPLQFVDYAVRQLEEFEGDRHQKHLSFWQQTLSSSSHYLSLPTDHPRPPQPSFHGMRRRVVLPEPLANRLKELSRRQGATLFMTLLAAFTTLLYRYSGQTDIVTGFPVANRNRPETENLIGSFVNTLALMTTIDGHSTFTELLYKVRASCLAAFSHQDYPFEKLVEELHPERRLNQNPLFQVFFSFQQTPPQHLSLKGLSIEPLEVSSTNTSKFDLTLSLTDHGPKLVGFFEYATDLFDRDRIERMARNFQMLLQAIASDSDQSIATLPILTEAERHQVLVEWNDTAADYPKDTCIHHLFEEQVERTPEAIAVEFEEQQMTYRELNQRANHLAHYLMTVGIGPEKLVGICVERSVEMVVGLLGILKAGGAYVPLDPAYPKERLGLMLNDANISVLLTQENLLDRAQHTGLSTQHFDVCLDRDWPLIAQHNDASPKQAVTSANLVYVIYTSGTTGQPKGVQIEHRSVVNCLTSIGKQIELKPQDAWLAVTTICFDIAALELFLPLLTGAKLIVTTTEESGDATRLIDRIKTSRPKFMQATPSLWQLIFETGWQCPAGFTILSGGEALPRRLADRFLDSTESVWNVYGPTESTIWSTTARVTANESSVPIGRPIANTQIYILDANLQPVPIGVSGELYIGGDGLARGYLNQPELTADKFIPNPFSGDPHSRLYRTGDLAKYRADSHIEFLGRSDNQIKIRGHRIELGEIESVLLEYAAVKHAVVVPFDEVASNSDNPKSEIENPKSLVAYLVGNHEPAPTVAELRRFLRERLPEFMIPSVFMFLNVLPLTPNGKIDRDALSAIDGEPAEYAHEFVEHRTEIEELVAQIWRELLKHDRIGIHDNFFEIGGHSLIATKVISRICELFHIELHLRTIFQAPTIAGLARAIESANESELQLVQCPILPLRSETLPQPAVAQEPLLRLARLFPNAHCFNIPAAYRLRGSLDLNALTFSLRAVAERHESLRTVFTLHFGRDVPSFIQPSSIMMEIVDLHGLAPQEREHKAKQLARQEAMVPFDLASGPLVRVTLITLDEITHLLLVTMNHIISDGWSMNIFFRDLTEFYKANVNELEPSLPHLPIQYSEFSRWQRDALEGQLMKAQLTYWKQQLHHPLRRLEFLTNSRDIDELPFFVRRKSLSITGDSFDSLKHLSQAERITPFMTLLTILNVLLYGFSGQEDIRVATLVANRNRREAENLIGHFVNSVIIRTSVLPGSGFRELALKVRDLALTAYINQDLPFEALLESLERDSNFDRASVCQVLFIYQPSFPYRVKFSGIAVDVIDDPKPIDQPELEITTFDLILVLKEKPFGLVGTLMYKLSVFDEPTIDRMIAQFYAILARCVVNPDSLVSELIT